MAQQPSYRTERVNELMRRELVLLLKQETKDRRLKQVVITDVIVSRDLTSAKVFFSVDEDSIKIVEPLLDKASGFFRSSLSKRIHYSAVWRCNVCLSSTFCAKNDNTNKSNFI